jgi:hypothetical protein
MKRCIFAADLRDLTAERLTAVIAGWDGITLHGNHISECFEESAAWGTVAI